MLVTPLQWLCEAAGYWQELEYAVVYANPEQELGCFQRPGIVYRSLQHGAMHYHAAT